MPATIYDVAKAGGLFDDEYLMALVEQSSSQIVTYPASTDNNYIQSSLSSLFL